MRRPTFLQIRTATLFFGGLSGVVYTTLIDQADRPTLLILFGAMMGLPLFLKVDETRPPPPPAATTNPSPPPVIPPPEDPR